MQVVISGYYGSGNLGDEAVLAGILRLLPAGTEPVVLSANPAETIRLHHVRAVPRFSMRSVISALENCDALISGGGTLFQDTTSFRSLVYYWSLIEMAHLLGKRVIICAQGLGPLYGLLSRLLTAHAWNRAALITMRDEPSMALAHDIGVSSPIHLIPDPALALEPPRIQDRGESDDSVVVVSIRPWKDWWNEASQARFAEMLKHVRERTGCRIEFLAMKNPDDVVLSHQIATCLECNPMVYAPENPQGALALLRKAQAVIGMRLHALILAASAGVPFVGIVYDPKVAGFAESVAQPAVASLPQIEGAFLRLWESHDHKKQTLVQHVLTLRTDLDKGKELIAQALQ